MEPFTVHTGVVATLDRANVDTDQIIPKQFLKRIERSGFGQFLFYDWRFQADGTTPNPEFGLNRPEWSDASILVARRNFGSGSSREHAVWALADYGFRCVIAPSFADIFYNNCFKNGVIPLVLSEEDVDLLFQRATPSEASGAAPAYRLTIDLEQNQIRDEAGFERPIEMDPFRRHCLLNGLDDIALTLEHEAKISAYEQAHPALR